MPDTTIHTFRPNRIDAGTLKAFVVGRDESLQDVLRLLSQPQSTSKKGFLFLGSCGSGKTTLLRLVRHEVEHNPALSLSWCAVQFKEEPYNITTAKDLFSEILSRSIDSLHHQPAPAIARDPSQLAADATSEAAPVAPAVILKRGLALVREAKRDEEALEASLATCREFRQQSGQRLLLLIENTFDLVDRLKRTGFSLSSIDSFFEDRSIFIVCTSTRLSRDRAFARFFHLKRLKPHTPEQQLEMLIRLARATRQDRLVRTIHSLAPRLQALHHFTRGIPRITMLLFEIIRDKSFRLDGGELELLLDRMTPYYRGCMANLSHQEAKILESLSSSEVESLTPSQLARYLGVGSSVVRMVLKRLSDNGWVSRSSRGKASFYRIEDPFLRIWLKMSANSSDASDRFRLLYDFLVDWHSREESLLPQQFQLSERPAAAPEIVPGASPERDLPEDMSYCVVLSSPAARRLIRPFQALEPLFDPGDRSAVDEQLAELDSYNFRNSDHFVYKGYYLAKQHDDHEGALEAFRHALDLRPNSVFALFNCAVALEKIGECIEAHHAYERVCAALAPAGVAGDGAELEHSLLHYILEDSSPGFGRLAAYLLGRQVYKDASGYSRIGELVAAALRDSQETWRREQCMIVLGLLRYEPAVRDLTRLLFLNIEALRRGAARALGQIRAHEATPALVELLQSEVPKGASEAALASAAGTRAEVAAALGRIGDPAAAEPLTAALEDPFAAVRADAADALARLGADLAMRSLGRLLADDDPYVRGRSAAALGHMESSEPVAWLIDALGDPNSYVCSRAAASLGFIGSPEAIAPLSALMRCSTDDDVLCKASVALCRLAALVPVDTLGEAVRHVKRLALQRVPRRAPAVMQMVVCHAFASGSTEKIRETISIVEQDPGFTRESCLPFHKGLEYLESGRDARLLGSFLPEIQEAVTLLAAPREAL